MRNFPLLLTDHLSVGYRNKSLISDINLSIYPGQIITLIGPNGAGKSTILKSIANQLQAISGTIYLENHPLPELSVSQAAQRMSVLLTDNRIPKFQTCYDVAAMGRYPYTGRFGQLSSHDHEVIRDCLFRVHATDIADHLYSEISDGQRQRVLLARALCQEPDVLILDEPTSFLDIFYKREFLEILLSEARNHHTAIIMSLHEVDLAEKISDLVVCVANNKIQCIGTPDAVFTDENISNLYNLTPGSYLVSRGSMELSRPTGKPQLFVLGGAGLGIPVYRSLQRKQLPFYSGILFENDMEYPVACALSDTVFSVPAFYPVSDFVIEEAIAALSQCSALILCHAPIGPFNQANQTLIEHAKKQGIQVKDTI